MSIYFWNYDLDPEFPFSVIEFVTRGDKDKIHWHNYLQIALCTGGRGKFIFTNKEYDIDKGDIFIINNFENHVAISESPEHIDFIFVLFLPSLIASPGSRNFDFEYLSPFWYNANTFNNKIDNSTETAKSVEKIIMELKDTWDAKEAAYRHIIDGNLRKMLGLLIQHYSVTCQDADSVNLHSHIKMQEALNFINQNFHRNITLEEVSCALHMSESRFRHLFKEIIHLSFKEYVTFLRLTECKKLLLTTDMNISDLAGSTGYTNIHQFYKVFNKYVLMSPAEYRKHYRHSEVKES